MTARGFTGQPEVQLAHAVQRPSRSAGKIAGLDRLALGDEARAPLGLRPTCRSCVTGDRQGARALQTTDLGMRRSRCRRPGSRC